MSDTSNQIKEAEHKVSVVLDELIIIKATAMAREIIGEFTLNHEIPSDVDKVSLWVENIDFENKVIDVGMGY